MSKKDLRVTLLGEDKTGKAFGSAGKNADGFGSKIGKVAKLAGVALGAAAVGFGVFAKGGVDAFARIEDATGAAGVQFGKASADVVKFAETASTNFGLSTGAALDAANTFGTMGKAAGLSGQDLAKFSTDFTGLAGDMASFKGTSPEQAIEAVGAALRGETEPIRAYGVLLDDASMRQEALALGLIKTTKEALTPQQKVLAAQSLIYKQTSDAQGDFSRTSDSTANTAKRLAAETENASAKLGQQLAPAVTFLREQFLNLVQTMSGMVTVIGPVFAAFGAAFKTGEVSATGFIGKVQEVGSFIGHVLIPAVQKFAQQAIPVLREALGSVVIGLTAVGTAIMSTVNFFREHDTAARALGVVVAGVAAGVAAAWTAQAAVATINAAKSVAAWFTTAAASTTSSTIQSKSTAQIVVGWAVQAAKATAHAAKVVAGWVATGVAAAASVAKQVAAWALLGAQSLMHAAKVAAAWLIAMGPIGVVIAAVIGLVVVIVKNWDTIKAKTVELWNAVKAATAAAWGAIKGMFNAALTAIKAAVTTYFNAYKAVVTTIFGAIKGAISAAWGAIKGVFSASLGAIQDAFSAAWGAIRGTATAAMGAIRGAISGGIGGVVSLVASMPGRMLGALGNMGGLLVNAGRQLMSGLARGIGERIAAVVQKVRDAVSKIKNLLPGSPIKEGPLRDAGWNNGGPGKELMGRLAGGIASASDLPAKAMARAVDFGDVTGMRVGGSGYVNRRLASTAASAPVEQVRKFELHMHGTLDAKITEQTLESMLLRMELLNGTP
jgi:phage-related protein